MWILAAAIIVALIYIIGYILVIWIEEEQDDKRDNYNYYD